MTEESLTIDELLKQLKQEPEAARNLVAEIVAQMTKEYLTIEEVAKRLSWEEKTVKNKMAAGIFRKNLHYFSPEGITPRFKWSAIVAWLEEKDKAAADQPTDAVPMARGYLLGQRQRKKVAAAS